MPHLRLSGTHRTCQYESVSAVQPPFPSPEHSLGPVLDAFPLAAFAFDGTGRATAANARGLALIGAGRREASVDVGVGDLFAGPEQGGADEVHRRVLDGTAVAGRAARPPQGGRAPRGPPDLDPAAPGRSRDRRRCWCWRTWSTSRGQSQRLAERLTSLARAAAELLLAKDLDEVTDIVTGHLADAAGATVASLSSWRTQGRLRLVGMRGGRPGALDRWRTYSTIGTPAGTRVDNGSTTDPDRPGRDPLPLPRHRDGRGRASGLWCACRCWSASRSIGVVTMTFPGRRTFSRHGAGVLQRHGRHLLAGD